jgi:hypothetical protein
MFLVHQRQLVGFLCAMTKDSTTSVSKVSSDHGHVSEARHHEGLNQFTPDSSRTDHQYIGCSNLQTMAMQCLEQVS